MTTRWSETPAYRDLMRNAEEWMALGDWMLDWQLGCAWYAGRRSVIESEEMAVVRDAARDLQSRIARERDGWPTPEAAAIRQAIEGLKP